MAREKQCQKCPDTFVPDSSDIQYKYSAEGKSQCSKCPNINRRCLCDTTPPRIYWGDIGLSDVSVCDDTCTEQCYRDARYSLTSTDTGRISEQMDWFNCTCKSAGSCAAKRNITGLCFLNDCDKPFNAELFKIVRYCHDESETVKPCSQACYESLAVHLPQLQQCNCYGTDDKAVCGGYKEFYKMCTKPGESWFAPVVSIISIALVLVFFVCLSITLYVRSTNRKLKRSGNLANILPHVDWTVVEPIGIVKEIITKNCDPLFTLGEREILLTVRFSVLNRVCLPLSRILKSEIVVVKLFSNSRSESQTKEISALNSISDKASAKAAHIIEVYGPSQDDYKSGVTEFLSDLVTQSPNFIILKDVIKMYYDERSKCILMNHCNGLSLSNFTKSKHSGKLPINHILTLCTDLAKALNFLHQNNPVIVHCDIKPHNIFVKIRRKRTSFILGDFGFAETYTAGEIWRLRGSTTAFLPPEWMISIEGAKTELWSPEQIKAVHEKDYKPNTVDIYQYGLIVWLVLHGKSDPWLGDPEYDMASQESTRTGDPEVTRKCLGNMFLRTFDKRPQFNYNGHVKKMSRNVFQGLQAISELCWQVNLSQRPTASDVLDRLEQLINNPKNVKFNMCYGNSDKISYKFDGNDIF